MLAVIRGNGVLRLDVNAKKISHVIQMQVQRVVMAFVWIQIQIGTTAVGVLKVVEMFVAQLRSVIQVFVLKKTYI